MTINRTRIARHRARLWRELWRLEHDLHLAELLHPDPASYRRFYHAAMQHIMRIIARMPPPTR